MKEKIIFAEISCPNTRRGKRYELTNQNGICPACGCFKGHTISVILEPRPDEVGQVDVYIDPNSSTTQEELAEEIADILSLGEASYGPEETV